VDTGDDAPIFRVTPEDQPREVFEYSTSSGVWTQVFLSSVSPSPSLPPDIVAIMTQVLKAIKKKPSVSVSGPEMFGYASPLIQMLFQELPGAE